MDAASYLRHADSYFRAVKGRAERALAQTADAAFFVQIDPESNSLAHVVKHVAGNLHSRWTDFLTTDGEKPTRRRDAEFVREDADSRAAVMADWESGWNVLFATLASLAPEDLDRTITIRSEPMSAFAAIERQKDHYAYHVGQIVFLAKHLAGPAWRSLSLARGRSEEFHAATRAAQAARSAGRGA